PCRQEHQRKCRGFLEAQPLGNGPEVAFRHDDRLREGTVAMLAEGLPPVAEAMLAAGAIIAGAVAQPRVKEDASPDRIPSRAGTVRRQDAGARDTADVGERDLWYAAAAREDIQVIQGRRPKRDQHLTRGRLR